jgi:hypothetical protein
LISFRGKIHIWTLADVIGSVVWIICWFSVEFICIFPKIGCDVAAAAALGATLSFTSE